MVGVQAKDEPEPVASVPSQSPAPPVIATQKSESAVPTVPKILNVPPPIARLVVEAVVEKREVVVALVVVELPEILRLPVKVEEALVKIIEEVVAETPAIG